MQIRLKKKRSLAECTHRGEQKCTAAGKSAARNCDEDDDEVNPRRGYVLVGMRACNDLADRGKLS